MKVALMPPEAKLPDEITVVTPVKIEDVVEINKEVEEKVVEVEEKAVEVEEKGEDKQ